MSWWHLMVAAGLLLAVYLITTNLLASPDKGKASEGMLNTLRGKTQSVTQHITWKNGFAAFGVVAILFSIVGWVNTENIVIAETTHTPPELCVGKRYDVLFKKGDGKKVSIILATGYTLDEEPEDTSKTIDIRLLYRISNDDRTIEYRLGSDGNSLIDKEGNVSPYTVQSPPTDGGFYLKIGENGIWKVPAGAFRVGIDFPEKMAKAKADA